MKRKGAERNGSSQKSSEKYNRAQDRIHEFEQQTDVRLWKCCTKTAGSATEKTGVKTGGNKKNKPSGSKESESCAQY